MLHKSDKQKTNQEIIEWIQSELQRLNDIRIKLEEKIEQHGEDDLLINTAIEALKHFERHIANYIKNKIDSEQSNNFIQEVKAVTCDSSNPLENFYAKWKKDFSVLTALKMALGTYPQDSLSLGNLSSLQFNSNDDTKCMQNNKEVLICGDLTLDINKAVFKYKEVILTNVPLGSIPVKFLISLLKTKGDIVGKETIGKEVYSFKNFSKDDAKAKLPFLKRDLGKYLLKLGLPELYVNEVKKMIRSVRGIGYQLDYPSHQK